MFRKLYVLFILVALGSLLLTGCKKEAPQEEVKTAAEYKADAEKEIDQSNMAAELENLEKEIAADEDVEQ